MWDIPVITDRTVPANRPDMVRHDKKKYLLLVNLAIPDDLKVNTKETEKLKKYKKLEIEAGRMWKVRTKTVPVITGALGTIKKGLGRNIRLLPAQPLAIELQKITLMGTAHSIR